MTALNVAVREPHDSGDLSPYFDALGLQPGNYSGPEIDRAFRKAALRSHPDKGGSIQAFKAVQEAYDILKPRVEEMEEAKQFDVLFFDVCIRKGPPGSGLGLTVVEDTKKKIIYVQEVLNTIEVVYFNPTSITELRTSDRLIGAGDDDMSTWPLSRVAQRLNDFRVPVGSEIVLHFSRRIPNANYRGPALDGSMNTAEMDELSSAQGTAQPSYQSAELDAILADYDQLKRTVDAFPADYRRLQIESVEKTEIIEDITEENDRMRAEIQKLQMALEESRRREKYLELQLRQTVLSAGMTEEQMIRSLKDMVKVSAAVQAGKPFDVAPELEAYLSQAGVSPADCSVDPSKEAIRAAICAMSAVDKSSNMMKKWALSVSALYSI